MVRFAPRPRPLRLVTGLLAASALAAGALVATAAGASATPAHPNGPRLAWKVLTTPTATARLRGLSVVSASVVWASGTEGTVLRSVDGGRTVQSVGPPGTADLQFRSLYASSADHAVAVSIGNTPDAFRVYVTDDGGRSWRITQQNTDPNGFYDCATFTSPRVGYILADPVNGKFGVLKTVDGGQSWRMLPSAGMPAARDGEFAFAASGTCIAHDARGDLFIGSGGVDPARVFRSTDGGLTWSVQNVAVAAGASSGIFSLSFSQPGWGPTAGFGVGVGGDYVATDATANTAVWTADAGRTWHPASGLGGYRSGSAWIDWLPFAVLAVGPTGSDVSWNGGRSYTTFDTGSFDGVDCVPGACYASGENGRLARLTLAGH